MSRFVLNSNNLWMSPITDKTIIVYHGSHSPDLNTQDIKGPSNWKQAARIGSNRHCTHRELEVFGVVFGGQKVQELWNGIAGQWRFINREGFMFMWRSNLHRRLNDLYDWSKHGVKVPLPLETKWDRFEVNTGKLMEGAGGGGSAQMKKEMEEKEKENQRRQAEKDKEIEELKKQAKKKEDEELAAKKENERLQAEKDKEIEKLKKEKDDQLAANKEKEKEIEELKKQAKEKDDQLAAKNKQIDNLRAALAAFT